MHALKRRDAASQVRRPCSDVLRGARRRQSGVRFIANRAERSEIFDADYYATGFGPVPYGRTAGWIEHFRGIAAEIARTLRPRTVLDVGCAHGLLVEALRDLDIDARGIDASSYAISHVRRDMVPYCTVGLATDDLAGPYDLVTSIEVVEHLFPDESDTAIARLCAASDTVLFSSSPTDFQEPTHYNVRRPIEWIRAFGTHRFVPDVRFDASFASPQAILFRRADAALDPLLEDVYGRSSMLAVELFAAKRDVANVTDDLATAKGAAATAVAELGTARAESSALRDDVESNRRAAELSGAETAELRRHLDAAVAESTALRGALDDAVLARDAVVRDAAETRARFEAAAADLGRTHDAVTAELAAAQAENARLLAHVDELDLALRKARLEQERLSAALDIAEVRRVELVARYHIAAARAGAGGADIRARTAQDDVMQDVGAPADAREPTVVDAEARDGSERQALADDAVEEIERLRAALALFVAREAQSAEASARVIESLIAAAGPERPAERFPVASALRALRRAARAVLPRS